MHAADGTFFGFLIAGLGAADLERALLLKVVLVCLVTIHLRPPRRLLGDDITQTFANAPTITARDTMLARMLDLLSKVTSLAHPLINSGRKTTAW